LKTLILGYGNPDRQDDGVAWHILRGLLSHFQQELSNDLDINVSDSKYGIDYLFQLQLTPELASDFNRYDRVCFVDAHTGAVPEDVHIERITAKFQHSPFTHHLTPASLISIAETLHHRSPEAILVSVRGFQFGFSQSLSEETASLTAPAIDTILKWLQS